MKKDIVILGLLMLLGCNSTTVEEPEKMIDEAQMVDIIYDLAMLEAMRSKDPIHNNSNPNRFIFEKYKIDSLQFAQNNRYYAADIDGYKKLYEKVEQRIKEEREALSPAGKSQPAISPAPAVSDSPQIQ